MRPIIVRRPYGNTESWRGYWEEWCDIGILPENKWWRNSSKFEIIHSPKRYSSLAWTVEWFRPDIPTLTWVICLWYVTPETWFRMPNTSRMSTTAVNLPVWSWAALWVTSSTSSFVATAIARPWICFTNWGIQNLLPEKTAGYHLFGRGFANMPKPVWKSSRTSDR